MTKTGRTPEFWKDKVGCVPFVVVPLKKDGYTLTMITKPSRSEESSASGVTLHYEGT